VSALTDRIDPGRIACRVRPGRSSRSGSRRPSRRGRCRTKLRPGCTPRRSRPPVNHHPVVAGSAGRGGGATRAGLRRWSVRPPPGGVRQRESDGGQVLAGGVPADAVAPCIGLDGDGGAGGDPGPAGLAAGLLAHPLPAAACRKSTRGAAIPLALSRQAPGSVRVHRSPPSGASLPGACLREAGLATRPCAEQTSAMPIFGTPISHAPISAAQTSPGARLLGRATPRPACRRRRLRHDMARRIHGCSTSLILTTVRARVTGHPAHVPPYLHPSVTARDVLGDSAGSAGI